MSAIKSLDAPDRRLRMLNLSTDCTQKEKKEVVCEPLSKCNTAYGGFKLINNSPPPNLTISIGPLMEFIPNNPNMLVQTPSFSVGYVAPNTSTGQGAALINKRAGTYMVNFNVNITCVANSGNFYAAVYVNDEPIPGYENFATLIPGTNANFGINGQVVLKAKSVIEVKFYATPGPLIVSFNELSFNINAA